MFYATGKHPLAGIVCFFLPVSPVLFLLTILRLQLIPCYSRFYSKCKAQIIDPNYQVNVLCNYFFAFGATFVVIPSRWYVTERIVEPWLWKTCPLDEDIDVGEDGNTAVTPQENRAFMLATGLLIVMVVGLVALLLPADSIFRDDRGMLASFKAPVMQSIVSLLFVFTGAVGLTYGILVGKFKSPQDVTKAMEDITKTLVQLIVFYFFVAQFLYAFGASNMGALIAVAGAEFLKSWHCRRRLQCSVSSFSLQC